VDSTIIYNIIAGRKGKPSSDVLEKIVLAFDSINLNWLVAGVGDKYSKNGQVKWSGNRSANEVKEITGLSLNEPEEAYEVAISEGIKTELKRLRNIEDEYLRHNNIIFVPMAARAGFLEGYGNQDYEKDLPRFSLPFLNRGTYYAFSVMGDSMYPTYTNGDIVVTIPVKSAAEIRPKEPYVIASHSDGLVLKRLRPSKKDDCIEFISDNKFYDPYDVPKTDFKDVFKVIQILTGNTGERNLYEDHILEILERIKSLEGKK